MARRKPPAIPDALLDQLPDGADPHSSCDSARAAWNHNRLSRFNMFVDGQLSITRQPGAAYNMSLLTDLPYGGRRMIYGTTLTLAANTSDTRLTGIARDLARDLARAGIETRQIEGTTAPGERGDAVTLGRLALSLVTSGAVTALMNCLKAYIARERTLIVRLKRPDGSEIEVNARNVGDPALEEVLSALPPS